MDIVERKITLENYRSKHHSFIPYVGIQYNGMGSPIFNDHANWGEYPYDIDLCKCDGYSNLKTYFGYNETAETARVSFLQLTEKYYILYNIIKNATYYQKIIKNGESKILIYTPELNEKYNIPIFDSEKVDNGEITPQISLYGLYPDNSFENNGGLEMLNFVLKALGMFVVDSEYIGDNYVPEIMYYTEIAPYREKMKKIQKNVDCCTQESYEMYGGDKFFNYLGGKMLEIQREIDYWNKSLYIINGEPVSSDMFITFALNCDFHNIGIYTVLNDKIEGNVNEEKYKCQNTENSKLQYLRHSKVSYCEETIDGITKEKELPFILVEDENSGKFVAKTPYVVGYAKNIEMVFGKFYGDLITDITPVTDENCDLITYFLGAEIEYDRSDKIWRVTDETIGIKYCEKVPYQICDFSNKHELSYTMIRNGLEVNAFQYPDLIVGINAVKVYEVNENAEVVTEFWICNDEEMTDDRIIMLDYNFGKIDTMVENVVDVRIDRGYVSAFELLYKMGEINTMEDIVSYSNNIFGL